MKYAISIITFLLVFGCSPQKKLQRLVKKHPELLQLDTIVIRDTIIIEDYVHDTTTVIRYHDSITVIDNSKVILKYFYDTLTREIHHEVECLGKEIITEKVIPYEKVVIQELTWWQKYGSLVIIISFLILFLLLIKRFGKLLL
tara:strand:+ start:9 stop:437 length:429 start_codon:yes stop_codon:yes gene_type:complete